MSRVAHPAGPRHAGVLPDDRPPRVCPRPPANLNDLFPHLWPRTAGRAGGALTIGGVDVRDLATEFGTPLFVCAEEDFRERCRGFRAAFGPQAAVCYAAQAFCCRGVLRWVAEEGLGVAACTGGELEVALRAGVPPGTITLHGSNKLPGELARALEAGVGRIVVDSFEEIARLAYLTDPLPGETPATRPGLLIRVAVGVAATRHEFVASEHDDQKSGFSLASGAAAEAVRRVQAAPGLDLAGLHTHIGSQIFGADGFEMAVRRLAGLAAQVHAADGPQIAELSLGGGFGISYTPDDDPPGVEVLARRLPEIVAAQWAAHDLAAPRLAVEPGRAIAGPGTITLYEVGTVKDVDGLRSYVSVDGGMSDNIRTACCDAVYTCVLASRESAAPAMLSRVAGRHGPGADIVVRDCYLPSDLVPGDLVAVAATGAYCRSMASNYNHMPRPAVVAVADGSARLLVRRETMDDLLRLDAG